MSCIENKGLTHMCIINDDAPKHYIKLILRERCKSNAIRIEWMKYLVDSCVGFPLAVYDGKQFNAQMRINVSVYVETIGWK